VERADDPSTVAAKIAPALLAGNSVVAKPAATTPLAALKLGELCADILPPGVIKPGTPDDKTAALPQGLERVQRALVGDPSPM
jgi:acyl-CoA reductase-like NAD-dependent aldehyde dehydrogenase